jgi:hypothetical protein
MEDSDSFNNWGPGLLTESQREYLVRGDNVESGSAHERTVRSRIRERVKHGMWDFLELWENADNRDLELIASDDRLLDRSINSTTGFALEIFLRRETEVSTNQDKEQVTELLESNIEHLIPGVLQIYGRHIEKCDVEIDVEFGTKLSSLSEDITDISNEELYSLFESGEISKSEFADEVARRGGPSEVFKL